jgi:hypothetical protein
VSKPSTKRRARSVRVTAIRSSDVSGFEVYAIDGEEDQLRVATVFLRPSKEGKQAEYRVFRASDDGVDPAATGAVRARTDAWDDEERERLVREIVDESGCDLPFVASDIEFLWTVEADDEDDEHDVSEDDANEDEED